MPSNHNMQRRKYLSAVSAVALAGCAQLDSVQEKEATTESRWPTQSTKSSPNRHPREWKGGRRDANHTGGKVVLENVTVELAGANVAQQVGVSTTTTDIENNEAIPSSAFEWYQAPEHAFIWFIYVNFIQHGDDREIPDPELWQAQPILEGDTTPVKSFTSSFDPDPTYYRLPSYQGREYTHRAYTNIADGAALQTMVFEVESGAIELLYGDPVRATWFYEIE